MALRNWPRDLLITRMEIQAVPQQIAHPIQGTDSEQILDLGFGTWEGVTVIAEQRDGRLVEAFLASLEGRKHSSEMPLHRLTIGPDPIAITAVTTQGYRLASRPDGLDIGVYVKVDRRVYVVDAITSGNTPLVGLWPARPLSVGDTVSAASTIRVKARGTLPMPRVRGHYGPWTFRWRESRDT